MSTEPEIRASDAERDATVTRLRDAAAEGRLTFEELADRVEAASTATTRGELAAVTRDLPATGTPPPAATGPGTEVGVPLDRSSVFGDVKQEGAWIVPAESRWSTVFGDVTLDLRQARVGTEVVHVAVNTVFGDVNLLVPEGVAVEVRSRTFFGEVRQEAGQSAPPGAPRVVLTGRTTFGDVRVRARRLREKLRDRFLAPPGPPGPPSPPLPPAPGP